MKRKRASGGCKTYLTGELVEALQKHLQKLDRERREPTLEDSQRTTK
jgi:hypothetical protein